MKKFSNLQPRKMLLIGALLSLSSAFATAFPLVQVLETNPLQIQEADADWSGFTFDGREFRLDFKSHYPTSKLNEVLLYFSDRNLNNQQARNISKLASHIALKCYNLLPERKTAIESWVSSWLSEDRVSEEKTFGPLLVDLQHTSNGEVLLWFTRTGVPGKSPWINHCIIGNS